MAQVTVRSLLSYNAEPAYIEPLPLYTPPERPLSHATDPETSSIRSAAPSYSSEVPAYTPRAPVQQHARPEQQGLPNRRYAPGFQPRPEGSIADVRNHNYNISNWSQVRSGHAAKTYENVARRRAEREDPVAAVLGGAGRRRSDPEDPLAAVLTWAQLPAGVTPPASYIHVGSKPAPAAIIAPLIPREDPELVGEMAAQRAKEQRLYREKCKNDPKAALSYESKGWDFMLAQMKDWEEREQSWSNFRNDIAGGRRKMLARRIGWKRR
ncbi:hypothetical protein EJ08DRAFT_700889 [Tothia fuscella]|uniref:Uncharacterized protein n=1 Tax=Tothia fuscella TaxID=1048955 RepID=A0A9P4NK32_9PEZI|nr:hypothetical protein EJ08DRAFT_700889 [Tothia fuscella]